MIKVNLKRNFIGRAWVLMLLCFALVLVPVTKVYGDECPEGGDHDYDVELIQQATNTEDGLRTYTCKKCGHTYDEVIESFGHQWTEWETTIEPQCEVTGVEERYCTKCDGIEQRRVSGLGHEWSEWVEEGDKEVRTCLRDPSHTQEREIIVITETEIVIEEIPVEEAPVEQPAEPEPEPEPEVEIVIVEEIEEPVTIIEQAVETEPEEVDEPETEKVQPEEEPEVQVEEQLEEESATEEEILVALNTNSNILTEEKEVEEELPEKTWLDEWTPANTAVAAGGSFALIGLGALLFIGYISPWLWILSKRRKKREEAQRRIYA